MADKPEETGEFDSCGLPELVGAFQALAKRGDRAHAQDAADEGPGHEIGARDGAAASPRA